MKTNILLINPPIYDFAAFDLWSKPLGLLYLSSILKAQGINVFLLDYMDRRFEGLSVYYEQNPGIKIPKGRHYLKQNISKPAPLKNIPRKYSRYGIPREIAASFLSSIPRPDIIIMTSIMTYWYPGILEAVQTLKALFPNTPLVLGGIYAALCPEHILTSLQARGFIVSHETSIQNPAPQTVFLSKGISLAELNPSLKALGIKAHIPSSFARYPAPDFSFYPKEYAVLRMSWGCPFRCSYCAQDILSGGGFISKEPNVIFDEICGFVKQGIKDIVFYDDALLYEPNLNLKPLLRLIISARLNIKIHTPNALHMRFLDFELARLMKEAGFILPRFSLETNNAALQKKTGSKINNKEFEKGVEMLKEAGFADGEFMVYLLMGMPGQSFEDIGNAIDYVKGLGGRISLSEYSLIPKTRDFEALRGVADFLDEPLLHNKSVYPLFDGSQWGKIYDLKLKSKK